MLFVRALVSSSSTKLAKSRSKYSVSTASFLYLSPAADSFLVAHDKLLKSDYVRSIALHLMYWISLP